MSLSAGPGAVTQTRGAELTAESQAAGCSGRAVTYLPIIWMKMEVQSEGAWGTGLGGGSARGSWELW